MMYLIIVIVFCGYGLIPPNCMADRSLRAYLYIHEDAQLWEDDLKTGHGSVEEKTGALMLHGTSLSTSLMTIVWNV